MTRRSRRYRKRHAREAWGLFLGRRPGQRAREAFERIWDEERSWEGWQRYNGRSDTRAEFEDAWKKHKAGQRRLAKRGSSARQAFEAGEKGRLLRIVKSYLKRNEPLPEWARDALIAAIDKADHFEIKSWDEVFGRLLKKGEQLASKRRHWVAERKVVKRVWDLRDEGKSITKELFDKVGKEVGVSGTVASDVYYDIMKMIGE